MSKPPLLEGVAKPGVLGNMYTRNYYNKNLRDAGRQLRKNMTPAERKIWYEFLRFIRPRAHRQRPMGNFIVDFYIPKAKLVIEIDGVIHENEKAVAKDFERTQFFKDSGIKILRYKNEQVMENFNYVCKSITTEVATRQTPPPYGHPL